MRKLRGLLFTAVISCSLVILFYNVSEAGISLPWSTTFNCPDWTQTIGSDNFNCDGITNLGYYLYGGFGSPANVSVMNASGNNPGGGGGKGFRVAYGPGWDVVAAVPKIYFNSPVHEFWIRFYMRWPSTAGMVAADDNQKLIYYGLNAAPPSDSVAGYIVMWGGSYELYTQYASTPTTYYSGGGAQSMWGGSYGDNKWHYIEMHFRANSPSGTKNGLWEIWQDGVKEGSYSGVDFYGDFTNFTIPNNDKFTASSSFYIDIDDIAIRTTGYIGPISGTSSAPPLAAPSPPTDLH